MSVTSYVLLIGMNMNRIDDQSYNILLNNIDLSLLNEKLKSLLPVNFEDTKSTTNTYLLIAYQNPITLECKVKVNTNKSTHYVYYKDSSFAQIHRDNLPAFISVLPNKIVIEEYYSNGVKHRENRPQKISYLDNVITSEVYKINNQLERKDGPAFTHCDKNGRKKTETYYLKNKIHRENGPAQIHYKENGEISEVYWYLHGELHCENGPAHIKYYSKIQKPIQEVWIQHNKLHNLNGPAWIEYDPSGNIIQEIWYKEGAFHNLNGPAKCIYNKNGILTDERWFKENQPHNMNGPTVIIRNNDGIITEEQWFEDGDEKNSNNGPTKRCYYDSGMLKSEEWYELDDDLFEKTGSEVKYHRLDGPADSLYSEDGKIIYQIWRKNGYLHNLNGPAVIINENDKLIKQWAINNKFLPITKLPRFENGQLCGRIKLTKASILKAMLFDREYGLFLQEMYKKIQNEKALNSKK